MAKIVQSRSLKTTHDNDDTSNPSIMTTHYDAIVVGLGGVGSFALRALAQESSGRFLGLEVGSLLSTIGTSSATATPTTTETTASISSAGHSSQGRTRIFRRAYFEHAHYVPWIDFSLQTFRDMQRKSGVSLMKECGTLLIEPSNRTKYDTTSLPPLLASSWNSAQKHDVAIEYLNTANLWERFPQFQYQGQGLSSLAGLLEPGGGFLRPERIMKLAIEDALNAGPQVTILDQTRITKLIDNVNGKGRFEVHVRQKSREDATMTGSSSTLHTAFTTDKLLVSMGAWTVDLIPEWKDILHPVRQIQGWIDTSERQAMPGFSETENAFGSQHMPTFVYLSPNWPESLYGVPCDDDEESIQTEQNRAQHQGDKNITSTRNWLKVGIHKQTVCKSFTMANHTPNASLAEVNELQSAIPHSMDRHAWPAKDGNKPSLVETKPCLYTMSPDKHFVIGEPKPNVFCVAGLSGHGFKMTPALGTILADFALEKDVASRWQIAFCSPTRFSIDTNRTTGRE